MNGASAIEQTNQGYVCPPDAGPAWRAACEYGFDMSLVEESLQRTEKQRLDDHQLALNRILFLTGGEYGSSE